jgi:hypothetical protein
MSCYVVDGIWNTWVQGKVVHREFWGIPGQLNESVNPDSAGSDFRIYGCSFQLCRRLCEEDAGRVDAKRLILVVPHPHEREVSGASAWK